MKKILLITGAALFLVACSAKLVEPIQADADRGAKEFDGLTLANLAEGKRLYEENCGLCHGKPKLSKHNTEEWKEIVPRMIRKSNGKRGEKIFTPEKEETLLQYILVMKDAPEREDEKHQ